MIVEHIQALLPNMPAGASPSAFRPGQVFQAGVQREGDQLFLPTQGGRIPMDPAWGFKEGQVLRAEVVAHAAGNKLQLSAMPTASGAAQTEAANDALIQMIRSLGLTFSPERLATLTPRQLPQQAQMLEQLFSLFTNRGELSSDLAQLQHFVSAFSTNQNAAAGSAQNLLSLMSQWSSLEGGDLKKMIQRWTSHQSLEARLAGPVPGEMSENLRVLLSQLLVDSTFAAWLEEQGATAPFKALCKRVADRCAASQLQNLRALEGKYFFMELPCLPESGLSHAQIHCFSEGKSGEKAFSRERFLLAFDLTTEALGNLWITLDAKEKHCVCHIKAEESEIIHTIRAASNELRELLKAQDYETVQVLVSRQQGARLENLFQIMQRFSSIDLSI